MSYVYNKEINLSHLNIKPENILVENNNKVKIYSFGEYEILNKIHNI